MDESEIRGWMGARTGVAGWERGQGCMGVRTGVGWE